ncbi:hypothetical protein DK427_04210 [Methylobacterium radiodurans]|uniref:Uncharacterized protein n=2 Tax=Methylobacterium radiodurans TaxID=2202828 RepID=A0A2U8VN46_9HYPH|nr:hypothetical protein DK427_04210 [Methylobacterium radiodurans]
MKIVFGGQLDRVFANEFAISMGLEPDDNVDLELVEERRAADARYFELAGTLAALSDEIVPLPYVRYAPDPVRDEGTLGTPVRVTDPEAFMQRLRAIFHFDQVTEEALDVARVCVLGRLAAASNDVLNAIDTKEAWIGHYHALRHLHNDDGRAETYLAGLLMQALWAWETAAVLVLAECDRFILADLGAILVKNRWPRPFAIPDLRYMGPPHDEKICGPLVNLRPADLPTVEAFRQEPSVRAYATSVFDAIRNAEAGHVGITLEKAYRSVGPGVPDGRADITLVAASVNMFSNAGTVTPGGQPDPDDWSNRRFPARKLRAIVLV